MFPAGKQEKILRVGEALGERVEGARTLLQGWPCVHVPAKQSNLSVWGCVLEEQHLGDQTVLSELYSYIDLTLEPLLSLVCSAELSLAVFCSCNSYTLCDFNADVWGASEFT